MNKSLTSKKRISVTILHILIHQLKPVINWQTPLISERCKEKSLIFSFMEPFMIAQERPDSRGAGVGVGMLRGAGDYLNWKYVWSSKIYLCFAVFRISKIYQESPVVFSAFIQNDWDRRWFLTHQDSEIWSSKNTKIPRPYVSNICSIYLDLLMF